MTRAGLVCLASLAPAACYGYDSCAMETVDFTLPAPGDGVEILVEACGPARRRDLELFLTLDTDRDPLEPLAITIDGASVDPIIDDDGWTSNFSFYSFARETDCNPGHPVTIRRLDSDPTFSVTGTLNAQMTAPSFASCSATLTVTSVP
jgi:hypothetical protein